MPELGEADVVVDEDETGVETDKSFDDAFYVERYFGNDPDAVYAVEFIEDVPHFYGIVTDNKDVYRLGSGRVLCSFHRPT